MLRDHVSALCSFESPLEGLRMIDGESGAAEIVQRAQHPLVLDTALLGHHAQMRELLLNVLGHSVTAGVRQPQQHLRPQITCLRLRDQWRNVFGLAPG